MSTTTKPAPIKVEQTNNVDVKQLLTDLINGNVAAITIANAVKAIQLLTSEDRQTMPMLKLNPVNLTVTKLKKTSSGYKTTANHEEVLTHLKTTGIMQTKKQIATALNWDESKSLQICQQLRNTNRPTNQRLTMVLTFEPNGLTTHNWVITDMLQSVNLGENHFITQQ